MSSQLSSVFHAQRGVATSAQILELIPRRAMQSQLRRGLLTKVWPNVYSNQHVTDLIRLRGLDLRTGETVAVCLGTAARVWGFDTESPRDLHVLNPDGHDLRSATGLAVHRRDGAPLITVRGRLITTPDWTAVEVARTLSRPRALATLDAALRSRTCDLRGLLAAAEQQSGRRGMAHVRELIPLSDRRSESPMEGEARLMMHDGRLPAPELQYWITDLDGRHWRVDFAWPGVPVVVEYDGVGFHVDEDDFIRDRQKLAALQEMGYTVITLVKDDVRLTPGKSVRRIRACLAAHGMVSGRGCHTFARCLVE